MLTHQTTVRSLNISAALSDVEDGTPPLNGTHILTDPNHGKAYYYNITGNVTYRPDPAYYGIDLVCTGIVTRVQPSLIMMIYRAMRISRKI